MRIIKYAYGGYLFFMPNGEVILWDGGIDFYCRRWAIPYLKARGVTEITIIVSHWHNETHTSSIPVFFRNFKVKALYTSGVYTNERPTDVPTKNLVLQRMEDQNTPMKIVQAGDQIMFGDVKVDILSPHEDIPNDMTDVGSYSPIGNYAGALIARFEYGNFSIMMTGDRSDRPSHWNPLKEALDLATTPVESTVFQIPHHGAYPDLIPSLPAMNMVRPKLLISSNMYPNTKQWAQDNNYDILYVDVVTPAYEIRPAEIVGSRSGSYTTRVLPKLNYPRCGIVT